MLSLILYVAFGMVVALFATENTQATSVTLAGQTVFGISVYVVVLVSLFLGILASWVVNFVNSIYSERTLEGKEAELKNALGTIDALKQKNRQLGVEIANLNEKIKQTEARTYEQLQKGKGPSIVDQVKYRFNRKYQLSK
jgi:hypothetical protein